MKNGLFLLGIFMSQMGFSADLDWQVKKNKDGIVAYTAHIESSANLAYRGETVMSGVTLDKMISIMRDVPGMSKWLHTCYQPRILKEEEGLSRIIHMRNSTPTFLVGERDLVLRQTITRTSEKSAKIRLTGLPNEIPSEKGFVRIPYFDGEWTFDETEQGLKVIYSGRIDPGGALPAIVTNAMVIDTPFETLRKLKEIVH